MELTVEPNYKIKADDRQWIVAQVRIAGKEAQNAGEPYDVNLSYHANLEQAARSLYNRLLLEEMGGNGGIDLVAIMDAVKDAEGRVIEVVRGVGA